MAIQMRRGIRADFDPAKLLPGEWAVAVDTDTKNQVVWMCFSAGVVKRMGTYEDFRQQIAEATDEIKQGYLEEFQELLEEMERLAEEVTRNKNLVVTVQSTITNAYLPEMRKHLAAASTNASKAETAAEEATKSKEAAKKSEDEAESCWRQAKLRAEEARNSAISAENFCIMADEHAVVSDEFAIKSESYAHGGTHSRVGESTDNGLYYKEQAQASAQTASTQAQAAAASASAAAASQTTAAQKATQAGASASTATTKATESANSAALSQSYAVGGTDTRTGEDTDNSKYYYQQSKSIYDNFSQAGTVTGVKGNAESAYRTGNVNITAANIGAVNKGGDTIPGRLNFINYAEVRFVTPDVTTGDHARGMAFMDKSGTEIWGGIGVLGRAGEPQYIYIGAGTPHPWNSSYGLRISDTHIKWKNSNLVTENSGTAKEATKATQDGNGNVIADTYTKKDGSNVTGTWSNLTAGNAIKATRDGNGSVIADTYAKKEWIYAGFASPQGGKLLIDLRDLSSHQEFLFVLCIAPDYNELEVYKNHLIPWAMLGTSEPYTKIHLHTEGNAHISVYRESGIPTVKVINDSYDYYVYIYAR